MPLGLGQKPFARGHITAADEQGREPEVLRTSGENGPVDQVANLFRLDAAVAEDLVGAGIDGHHSVEDTRLRIAVDLDEDFTLVHGDRYLFRLANFFLPSPPLRERGWG